MSPDLFINRTPVDASVDEVFSWYSRPGALERLTPPWENIRIVQRAENLKDGTRVIIEIPLGPFRLDWILEHREYLKGRQFQDVQIRGPFAYWAHMHRFVSAGADQCLLEDRVEYKVPFGPLARMIGEPFVANRLTRLFRYRMEVLEHDLRLNGATAGMKIAVSGTHGLVGSSLVPFLSTAGHAVSRLVRSRGQRGDIVWKPVHEKIQSALLEGQDAVIHLAGENIGSRWSARKKQKIRRSRVEGTRFLCETLAKLEHPPRVLICASAVGYYGDRDDELLTEASAPGKSFMADVCREWEAATEPARARGIRVVHLRLGVVLSPAGGALARMIPLFKFGIGGRLGDGRQYMSWVAMDDVLGAVDHVLRHEEINGPVNVVAPQAVSNFDFTKTLAQVLHRPAVLPAPAFMLRLLFGEMANAALLASARVEPEVLKKTNYAFRYPELEGALRHVLGA